MTSPSVPTPESLKQCFTVASTWIDSLRSAFELEDADAFADCVDAQGWFRDLMTFSWDYKSLHGHEDIKKYVSQSIKDVKISDLKLEEESAEGRPHPNQLGQTPMVESGLWFETPKAKGRGYVLIPLVEGERKPRAFALFLMLDDWKGHEELGYELGIYDGHNLSWEEVQAQRHREIETDPDALIGESIYQKSISVHTYLFNSQLGEDRPASTSLHDSVK